MAMEFEKRLPMWNAPGVEPPISKTDEGWKKNERPPAEYMNFLHHTTFEAIKELQENSLHKDGEELVVIAEKFNGEIRSLTEYVETKSEENTQKIEKQKYFVSIQEFERIHPETSDSGRIQRAIDSLPSRGGTVFFPAETLSYTGSVNISNKSKITLLGNGFNAIQQATGTSENPINFPLFNLTNTGSSKVFISGIVFQCFETNSGAAAIKTNGNLVDVVIESCWFTQTGKAIEGEFTTLKFINNIVELMKYGGLYCESSNFRKIVISNNQWFGVNGDHIHLKNLSTNKNMHNITIVGNGFDQGLANAHIATGVNSVGNAIFLEGVDLFTITGNYFNGYTPAMNGQPETKQKGHAIRLKNCSNFEIGANTYSKYKGSAFYFENCNNFEAHGFAEGFDEDAFVFVDCSFFDINVSAQKSKVGIYLLRCAHFKTHGICNSNREYGVLVLDSSNGRIETNAINNNTSGLENIYGIFLNGMTTRVRILNADVYISDSRMAGQTRNIVLASSTSHCKVSNCNAFPFIEGSISNNGSNNTIDNNNVVS